MNERKLLGLALVLVGGIGGFIAGAFVVILPTSEPYRQDFITGHFNCGPFGTNSTWTCVYVGETVQEKICVKSYWWGELCRTYKTVNR